MKIVNKCLAATLAGCLSILSLSTSIYAIETDTIDELWGKPTVVYGGGLSDDQIAQTQSLFGISNPDNVYQLTVDANDLGTYLNFYGGSTSSLISSVLVKKTSSNGVNVKILTPENITTITSEQYANAAITAGVNNCEIEVASITQVTGESALTGVYKAFEANGETLDPERTAIAQDELEITNQIANELEQNDQNSEILDQVMVEIKQEMAKVKQEDGSISYEDIVDIVNRIIEKYGLQNILSENNINIIINFAQQYANTSAIDSQEVLEQLKSLSGDLSKSIDQFYNYAKETGLWDKIVAFVKQLVSQFS